MNREVYIKNKNALLVWAGPIAWLVYEFYGYIEYFISSFDGIWSLSHFTFFMCIIESLLALLLFYRSRLAGLHEVTAVYRGRNWFRKQIFFRILVLFIFTNLVIVTGLICLVRTNDAVPAFSAIPVCKAYAVNLLIPQIICILLSYMLADLESLSFASAIWLFFMTMISPFFDSISWHSKPGFPIDKMIEILRHPFMILYQNIGFNHDLQYGLQTNIVRIEVQIFWFLFLGAVIAWQSLKKKKCRIICSSVMALACVICLIISYLPSDNHMFNDNWDNVSYDWNYYLERDNTTLLTCEDTSVISGYELDVSLKRQLRVEGKLHFIAEEEQNSFGFTLYHGYRIKKLGSDQVTDWEQDGDYVVIHTKKPLKELAVEITYSGKHPVYYANDEACMLPGWFPWYPMDGKRKVLSNLSGGVTFYNTMNRIDADISMKIHADYPFVTNLEETADGQYDCHADSISLVGGLIYKTGDETVVDFIPFEIADNSEDPIGTYAVSIKETYEDAIDVLENVYGLDVEHLRGKKIMIADHTMSFTSMNVTDSVVFDDYILSIDTGVYCYSLIRAMLGDRIIQTDYDDLAYIFSLSSFENSISDTHRYLVDNVNFLSNNSSSSLCRPLYKLLMKAHTEEEKTMLIRKLLNWTLSEERAGGKISDLEYIEMLTEKEE